MSSREWAKVLPGTGPLIPVGYLGWDGHGNLGDDVIRDALAASLPTLRFVRMPLTFREFARFVLQAHTNNLGRMHLLLGGGTVIGRRNWRIPITVDLALCGQAPPLMIGAGVEDPIFQGRHSFSRGAELSKWKHLLLRFDRVSVRGPRSAELLADQGVESRIVGDPALLIDYPVPMDPRVDGVIGVNLGFGSDLWSHDQGAVVAHVAQAVRMLQLGRGFRFRFLVVNSEDKRWVLQCIAQADIPEGSYDVHFCESVGPYVDAVQNCSMVIAERLHAAVLAAACNVPILMLEYQPKCRDFMASLDQEQWNIRTDRLNAGTLVDHALWLIDSIAANRAALNTGVQRLRLRLSEEVARVESLTSVG